MSTTLAPEVIERNKKLMRGSVSAGQRFWENFIERVLLGCGLLSIVVTLT